MEKPWRWTLGMLYVIAVALIWISASFVVQSVVGAGVSPFLIAYVCNSLFVVYLPIVEGTTLLNKWLLRRSSKADNETVELLEDRNPNTSLEDAEADAPVHAEVVVAQEGDDDERLAAPREWSRWEIAKVSLLICPFWFVAQFTFNLSLKYTSVTSNTILSSASSLFTFLLSLALLNEKFSFTKLGSVLLCMLGTITVTLADSSPGSSKASSFPRAGLGDMLCLFSALAYALYSTLIRKRLPDEEAGEGRASTALFFGYLGLFNAILLAPVGVVLQLMGLETFGRVTWPQFGLIIGKGLLDNVLSDYLWAKAVLLTTPTAATAGLNIQIPIAAAVDTLRGKVPSPLSLLGAVAVLVGFLGINQPATGCCAGSEDEDVDDFGNAKHGSSAATV